MDDLDNNNVEPEDEGADEARYTVALRRAAPGGRASTAVDGHAGRTDGTASEENKRARGKGGPVGERVSANRGTS
ncbi:MAG: hypothetical protein ABSD78_19225 [Acidimicrobiales bacterium]|jgi:hypothetical protein